MESMLCPTTPASERRKSPRMPYGATAFFQSPSVSGAGTIKDISPEGLFLQTPFPLDKGAPVRVMFRLRHSQHPMDVQGEIARSTQTGVGIRFVWDA